MRNALSPSFLSDPQAPSAGPVAPPTVRSPRDVARLSMLLAADRQAGVEVGETTVAVAAATAAALTTVAWDFRQLGRASGGMASISKALMSSA